jgi:hypothetical protein
MAGPIHGEGRTSWASGTDASSVSSRSSRSRAMRNSNPVDAGDAPGRDSHIYFSPEEYRLIEESPLPISPNPVESSKAVTPDPGAPENHLAVGHAHGSEPGRVSPSLTEVARDTLSAPAVIGRPHRSFASASADMQEPERIRANAASLHAIPAPPSIELDEEAPIRAARDKQSSMREAALARSASLRHGDGPSSLKPVTEEDEKPEPDQDGVMRRDHAFETPPEASEGGTSDESPAAQLENGGEAAVREASDHPWGGSFKVEWIRHERLPFWRTRHLRNPWNQDREVKVSRDGTELEPAVGQALLEEWDREDPPQSPTAIRPRRPPGSKLADTLTSIPPNPNEGP